MPNHKDSAVGLKKYVRASRTKGPYFILTDNQSTQLRDVITVFYSVKVAKESIKKNSKSIAFLKF